MPKVEQYGLPKVETAIASKPRARNAPASSFGLNYAADAASSVGNDLIEMQQRIDTTAAEEAAVLFERDKNKLFFDPDEGYFNTQGRNAYDGAKDVSTALGELQKQHGASLSSEQSKRMFNRVAQQHVTSGNSSIMRHASSGFNAWEVATMKSQVENTIENAVLSWNDAEGLKVQESLGEQAIIDINNKMGLDGDAMRESLETYRSSFASAAITAATAKSAAAGEDLLERLGKRLEGPDKLKIEAAIVTKKKAEKTSVDASTAINLASSLHRDNLSRTEALDAAEAQLSGEDQAELRKSTRIEIDRLYRQDSTAEKESKADAWEYAQEVVFSDSVATGGLSAAAFQQKAGDIWNLLTYDQQTKLRAGKKTVTNQALLHGLVATSPNKLAELDWTDYVDKLSSSDLGTIKTAITNAKEGKHNTYLTAMSQVMVKAANDLFGESADRNTAEAEKVNEFYLAMQTSLKLAEDSKGAKLTPTELQSVITNTTGEIIINKPWYQFDVNHTVKNTPVADVMAMNSVAIKLGRSPKVEKYIVDIRDNLIENDIPVTAENILKAYNSGL
tara:strand:- start:3714 stop:5396 length:1683 start_codon:yes stop_codon:yes gene_type:complete